MCGIWGWWRRNGAPPPDDAEIERITEPMRSRGPDDFRTWRSAAGIAMGFRRLSIIDLEAGQQPIANEDGSVQVCLNGEIYNFVELRERLRGLGHRFRTRSDSEVIAHGYEEWGDRVFDELAGMFAIAIWDERARRLVLARDRLGIKPLYLLEADACFGYASDPRTLVTMPEAGAELDPEALALYLFYGYVPAPWSAWRGVRKLRPGERCVVDAAGVRVQRYWDLVFDPRPECLEASTARFAELFQRVVGQHLIADVPLGSFLSGGMDSTSVVQAASEVSTGPVLTFNLAFRDAAADESRWARRAAEILGTNHHELALENDPADRIEATLEQFPEPFGDSAAVPNAELSALIRSLCTVALSGDGGDEVFAGYSLRTAQAATLLRKLPRPLRRAGAAVPRAGRLFEAALLDLPTQYARSRARMTADEVDDVLDPGCGTRRAIEAHHDLMRDELRRANVTGLVNPSLYLDQRFGLPDQMLTKVDVTSMAHSLEVRVPFLDHRIVEFAATLPESAKQWGFGARRSKRVIRRFLGRRFPASFIHRPKLGFGMPLKGDLLSRLRAEVGRGDGWMARLPAGVRVDRVRARGGEGRLSADALWTLSALSTWNDRVARKLVTREPRPAGSSRAHGNA